ncbi:MAG: hypothetical protein GC171_14770 [Terrimonas sp.]|nr:hypothetical protein [Terrimonas sp.]
MNNKWFNKMLPHIAAVLIFLVISVIYCAPALKGDVVNQQDHLQWRSMAQQSFEFKEKNGHFPLWTNSMFSGMPAYQIALGQTHPVSIGYASYIFTLGLPKPINFFFLACIGFYILLLIMRINPWVGIMGAIAYAYSTYDPVIIVTGHDTKMMAIGYAPMVIGAFVLLFRKNYLGGAVLLAFSLGLELSTAHLQMVYYTLMTAGIMSIFFLWQCIKNKEIPHALKSFGIAILIGLISIGTTAVSTLTTYDYAQYSMRGGDSELKSDTTKTATSGGLDKGYAFLWSYGLAETFTLFQPSFYGGGNGGHQLGADAKMTEKLTGIGYPEEDALSMTNNFSYWGKQPGTSGPVYLGIIICFLFILGMIYLKNWHKWWILAACVFAIILAWGKNFEAVNYFLFDYLPLYKKFRAPTQSLVIPQLCFPLLAAMLLQAIFFENPDKAVLLKKLKLTGIITGALFAVFLLFYSTASFSSDRDARLRDNFSSNYVQQLSQGAAPTPEMQMQGQEFGKSFVTAIQSDRQSLFLKDTFRNLFFAAAAFLLLFLFIKGKANRNTVLTILILLCSIDLISIARRYLNTSDFEDADLYERAFTMSPADMQIKQDTGYYRVYNQASGDVYQDAYTSYHHNSIGGYHPAKLRIYQDLIEGQLYKGNKRVLDMLNTKYFIFQNPQTGQPVAQINPDAFGPAWLVKGIRFVPDAQAEMKALDSADLKDTAIVQERFKVDIKSIPGSDSAATLTLTGNQNDVIHYSFNSTTDQFAVFSEIYYKGGWKAYIENNKPAPIIKTDYALRGLYLPAGKYTVTFKFEPASYALGNTLTLICSILVYLLGIAYVVVYYRKKKKTGTAVAQP